MDFLVNVYELVLTGIKWCIAHPDNVGIYLGTAAAIAGSISALKTVRIKLKNTVFKKFTLRALNGFLSGLIGVLTAYLQLQPLAGAESALYPIALVPAVTVIYRIASGIQDWIKQVNEKRQAQQTLVNNTMLNPTPEATPVSEDKLF